MAFGLAKTLSRMAASAAILLSSFRAASAEVCDKAYPFDYSDLAPVNAATEFLMIAAGPIGGLIVFLVGLYLATSKPGALFGLSASLWTIGLSPYLATRDEQFETLMIEGGCAAPNSVVEPVLLTAAAMIAVMTAFKISYGTSSAARSP